MFGVQAVVLTFSVRLMASGVVLPGIMLMAGSSSQVRTIWRIPIRMVGSVLLAALPVMSSTSVCRNSFLRSAAYSTLLAASFSAQRVAHVSVPYSGSPTSPLFLPQQRSIPSGRASAADGMERLQPTRQTFSKSLDASFDII